MFGKLFAATFLLGAACAGALEGGVPKPEQIPEAVKPLFSDDPKFTLAQRLKVLGELPAAKDEAVMQALRWLVWQKNQATKLRVEIVRLLDHWEATWVVGDMRKMLEDREQPAEWRGLVPGLLADHHYWYEDDESATAVEAATASTLSVARDAALQALAVLARRTWAKSEKQGHRYARGLEFLKKAIREGEPGAARAAFRAAASAELTEFSSLAENTAGDEKQASSARVAALKSLHVLYRLETLAMLKSMPKPEDPAVAEAVEECLPYAYVAQLSHPDEARREQAFAWLAEQGAAAKAALEYHVRRWHLVIPETEALRYSGLEMSRTLLGDLIVKEFGMGVTDRREWKPLLNAGPEGKSIPVPEVTMDREKKLLSFQGDFCLEMGALEYAIVQRREGAKTHEAVIALNVQPMNVCLALLVCEYPVAGAFRSKGKTELPKGAGIMLSVEYQRVRRTPKGSETQLVRLPLETFIYNTDTCKPMKRAPWAFTGGETTTVEGRKVYLPDEERNIAAIKQDERDAQGNLLPDRAAVINATLDTASEANVGQDRTGALYEINAAITPRRTVPRTECFLIMEPWTGTELRPEDLKDHAAKKEPKE